MTETPAKPTRPAPKPDRAKREATALRANLLKRKEQVRLRTNPEDLKVAQPDNAAKTEG